MGILIKNQQKHRWLNKARIKKVAQRILSILEQPTAELSILFVGDKKMQELNTTFRCVNKTTDVLSFPQIPLPLLTSHFLLGDIVINLNQARRQAKTHGLSFYDEIYRLLIHGVLHLLGYDHEKSVYRTRIMIKKEQEIFNAIKKVP